MEDQLGRVRPPTWRLAAASEIRRRGEARRRRRATASGIGAAAAAVAVLAVASTAVLPRHPAPPEAAGSTGVRASERPTSQPPRIPAEFPLARGLGAAPAGAALLSDATPPPQLRICGRPWVVTDGTDVVDERVTGWRGGHVEDSRRLTVFVTARDARDAVARARALAATCATTPSAVPAGRDSATATVRLALGQESLALVDASRGTSAPVVVDGALVLVRVHNALLVARTAFPESRTRLLVDTEDGLRSRLGPVVASMCRLTGSAC